MEILTRKKCACCNGDGMVTPAIWKIFYEADEIWKKSYGSCMDENEMKKWFAEKGHYSIQSEERQCNECNGTGQVESWITIEQLMKEQYKEIFKFLTGNANKQTT